MTVGRATQTHGPEAGTRPTDVCGASSRLVTRIGQRNAAVQDELLAATTASNAWTRL